MFSEALFILLVSAGIAYGLIALFVFAILVLRIAFGSELRYRDGRPAGIPYRILLIVIGLVMSIIWPIVLIFGRKKFNKAQ